MSLIRPSDLGLAHSTDLHEIAMAAQKSVGHGGAILDLGPGLFTANRPIPVDRLLIRGDDPITTQINFWDCGRLCFGWRPEPEPATMPFANRDSQGRRRWLFLPTTPFTHGRYPDRWKGIGQVTWTARFRFPEGTQPGAGVYLSALDDQDRAHFRLVKRHASPAWSLWWTTGTTANPARHHIGFDADPVDDVLTFRFTLGLEAGSRTVEVNGATVRTIPYQRFFLDEDRMIQSKSRLRGCLFSGLKVGADGPFSMWDGAKEHWPYAVPGDDFTWSLEQLSLDCEHGPLAHLYAEPHLPDGIGVRLGKASGSADGIGIVHLVGSANQLHPHTEGSVHHLGLEGVSVQALSHWSQPISLGMTFDARLHRVQSKLGAVQPIQTIGTLSTSHSWKHRIKECWIDGWDTGLVMADSMALIDDLRIHYPGLHAVRFRSPGVWLHHFETGAPTRELEYFAYIEGRESGGTLTIEDGFIDNEHDLESLDAILFYDATYHLPNRLTCHRLWCGNAPKRAMVILKVRDYPPGLHDPGWLDIAQLDHNQSHRIKTPLIDYHDANARKYWAKMVAKAEPDHETRLIGARRS